MGVARTIAKNTLFNFITNASDVLINFGVGILLARFLGPTDYGLYSFLIWFLYFAALFVNLGLGNMVIRYIAEALGKKNIELVKSLVRISLWLRVGASILIALIIIVFVRFWAKLFGYPGSEALFIILSLGILPHVLNFLLTSIFNGFQKFEYSAYLMLATNPLRALGIVIVYIMGLGVKEILFASISSWVLGVFIGLFLMRRLVPLKDIITVPRLNPELKSSLKYSMIMTGILIMGYFQTQRAEIFFLGIYHPGEQVGFYTIAFLLATSSIGLILMVFSEVLVPAVSEQFGRGDMERVRAIYLASARYLMMVGIPLALGGIALASPIITLVYGAEYTPVIPLLQILLIPFAFLAIANAATGVIYGMNQPSFILKVGVFLVIMSIGFDLWLIPKYSSIGAAIGSSVPRLIAPIIYIYFASRKCQTSWPIRDTLRITFSAILMGVIIYVLHLQIKSPLISLLLLLPLGVVIHMISLLFLGAIRQNDIDIMKRIQDNLPKRIRGSYAFLLGLVEKLVKKPTIIKSR
jgi:O-antigen/teichoic acid export membrane protein